MTHNAPSIPQFWDVPCFEQYVFSQKVAKYALVIPVVNEGARLSRLLTAIKENNTAIADIVIADGGSSDGSVDEAALRTQGVRALLVKTDHGRLSAQLRMAYAWCLHEGYSGIVTIDGNGKDDPASLPLFVQSLENGMDYTQASRFIKGGTAKNTPIVRWLAIRAIHAPLISLSARTWLTDTTQGYRAYSSAYLLHPQVQPFRNVFMNYELLAYLSVRAGQLGLTVRELPTSRIYPAQGPTPTKISGCKGNLDLLKTLFKTLRGDYAPPLSIRGRHT